MNDESDKYYIELWKELREEWLTINYFINKLKNIYPWLYFDKEKNWLVIPMLDVHKGKVEEAWKIEFSLGPLEDMKPFEADVDDITKYLYPEPRIVLRTIRSILNREWELYVSREDGHLYAAIKVTKNYYLYSSIGWPDVFKELLKQSKTNEK